MRTVKKLSLLACLFAGTAFADDNFEYHGYLRVGGGWSEGGTEQSCFKLANSPGYTASRLGNECGGMYSELTLSNKMGDPESDKPWFKSNFTLAFVADLFDTWEATDDDDLTISLREAYITGGNLLPNDAMLWMGKRFYRRHDIHMLDLFITEHNGGRGVGVEGYKLGDKSLSVAVMQHRADGTFQSGSESYAAPVETSIDARFQAESWEAILLVGSQSSRASRSGKKVFEAMSGQSITGIYSSALAGGQSKLFAQFGAGLYGPIAGGVNPFFANASPASVVFKGDDASKDNIAKSHSLRLAEQWVKSTDTMDLGVSAVLQSDNLGETKLSSQEDAELRTIALGEVRASYYFSDFWKATLDVAHVNIGKNLIVENSQTVQKDQSLNKVTLAAEAVKEKGYWARPSLRFFVTVASWSSDSKGSIEGALPFQVTETNAATYGFQAEWWY